MLLLTSSDAQSRAVGYARAVAGLGVRPGDRVAVVTPEHRDTPRAAAVAQAEVLGLVLGALRSGVVPVMVNPLLTAEERDYILADCNPSLVLADARDLRSLADRDTAQRGPSPELADVPLGRPMHYTSGTTGRPKGVWTHGLSEQESRQLWGDEQELWQFADDDVSLVHGPLCHSGPLRFALSVLLAGGSVVLQGSFDAGRTARAMVDYRPTTAFVVPSHLQRLFALPEPPAPTYRLLAHAGAACPPALKRQTHRWAGVQRVWEFYGSTEGQFSACSGPEWEERPGTVGRARSGRRLFTDEGVIWCEAPVFARFRYWGDEEKTTRAWRDTPAAEGRPPGRAFTVGDLGRLDEHGYLFIEGRREDLIISGGVNVYPAEVEAVLQACPGVSEVAVYGRPDDRWGQRVCAAYLGDAEPEAVRVWASERLAGHKRPKSVERRSELPRTASGKIKRLSL